MFYTLIKHGHFYQSERAQDPNCITILFLVQMALLDISLAAEWATLAKIKITQLLTYKI